MRETTGADTPEPLDPLALAAEVRAVAREADRATRSGPAGPARLRDLVGRIARLRAGLPGGRATPLHGWLKSLKARVEAARAGSRAA